MGDAGGVEMPDRRHQAALAIVEGVIVGAGHDADAEPLQFVEQFRRSRHVGPDGDARRSLVGMAHRTLEIGEGHVGAANDVAERGERGFAPDADAPREHDVAAKGDVEIAGFGFVEHSVPPVRAAAA